MIHFGRTASTRYPLGHFPPWGLTMAENQSSDSTANANAPRVLCSKGCGFFGTPSTLNMCSTCFRDHQKHENPQNGAETAASTMAAAAAAAAASIAAASVAVKSASPPSRLSDASAPQLLLPPNVASAHQLLRPTTPPPTATNLAEAVAAVEAASAGSLEASTAAAAATMTGSPQRFSAMTAAAPTTPPAILHLPTSATQIVAPPSPPALKRKASYPRADEDMATPSEEGTASTAAPADEVPDLPARKVQKDKRRCFSCRKKVGLTALPCRCGYVYCGAHRMATDHNCDFDYKTHARTVLAGANPLVAAVKVNKI